MEIKNYIALGRFTILVLVILGLNAQALLAQAPDKSLESRNLTSYQESEILWLSRVIYSETKDEDEQWMIAWVVRNRVEAGFRGAKNYEDVALDPLQFSGLNKIDRQFKHNISRSVDSEGESWSTAKSIAEGVYFAPSMFSPISNETLHFYSPIATKTPDWA